MTLKTFVKKVYHKVLRTDKPSQKPIPTIEFLGDYPTWEAAQKDCEGYDGNAIFEKVSNATLAVKRGEAAYERDSVLFYKKEFDYPLCAYLNKIALRKSDYLSVVDWGGGVGQYIFPEQGVAARKNKLDNR